MAKRSPTTKDVALLWQLFKEGQIVLASEFQRNSVWPKAAKAYLIDTILNDRPIPIFFLQRTTSSQTGRPSYTVIDGQQRLRAIFDYLDDRFALTESSKLATYYNKFFSSLTEDQKDHIRNYDLVVEELSGYSEPDIRDMFVRMNKYVVKLSPQELRHAREKGQFKDFVERLGTWDFWTLHKVFSPTQMRRMKAVEFSAEVAILLLEGPQDKKTAVDLYYVQYAKSFGGGGLVESKLKSYMSWIVSALPDFEERRFRKAVDLYSLLGALDRESNDGKTLSKFRAERCGQALTRFEQLTKSRVPTGDAARYVVAASRQTDNLIPRRTRIEVLAKVLHTA